jgi:hypothetical protein
MEEHDTPQIDCGRAANVESLRVETRATGAGAGPEWRLDTELDYSLHQRFAAWMAGLGFAQTGVGCTLRRRARRPVAVGDER